MMCSKLAMESTNSDSQLMALMDVTIERLSAELEDLKARRNSFAPVSKLPPEIMEKIFLFRRDGHSTAYGFIDSWQWIREVSHVCRSWRLVALHSRQLWSLLSFESSSCAKLLLERSRGSDGGPISVEILWDMREEDEEYMWNTLSSEAHRLQSFVIHRVAGGSDNCAWPLPSAPAPILESLRMELLESYDSPTATDLNILKLDHSHLFGGCTPRLRHLEVISMLIPWNSTIFTSNITTLTLTWEEGILLNPVVSLGTPAEFFQALERMPALENLDLYQIFDPTMKNFRSNKIVSLPKMKMFSLKAPTKQCTTIFKHLALPITASLDLNPIRLVNGRSGAYPDELSNKPCHISDLRKLMAALQAAWMPHAKRCGSLSLHFRSFEFGKEGFFHFQPNVPRCHMNAHIQPGTLKLYPYELLFFSVLHISTIQSIGIEPDFKELERGWGVFDGIERIRTLIEYFPNTKHISLRGSISHSAFMEHLKDYVFQPPDSEDEDTNSSSEDDSSPSEQAVRTNKFEGLISITLRVVKFKVLESDDEDHIEVQDLLKFCQMQSERGSRLQYLRLLDAYGLEEGDVEKLKSLVGHLEYTAYEA
ncbi:hypothetical protein CVT24_003086 [Panaeolus cyanescens]|uniref:F-box domain-containing protein n=1 Tax=Panaeolus cyanescens TaxID=181874 RepID=A0A409W8Q9_9AGAR|nr:hypothetical protein CVT24_003086 [Panaeolus cyanescens]